ncbi:adenosine receptor A3-like [Orbicella faveolata]|uniref:adenosine receptor A3-like n=1 Tax=Orbicella faveolata TaxID=48498 RepID=UPI0009E2FDBC|nr:adenosine receptor A3-like [Orbicella faveolata]
MANITGDGNFTSKLNQVLSSPPADIIEFFSTLNIFLSVTPSLGNVLLLVALHRVTSIYPPNKLFFRCLTITDLGVGILVQPLYVTDMLATFKNMNVNARRSISDARCVSSLILCGVSLLTSAAISVDRLLAVLLGLRYRHVVTLRRVRVVIICVWLVGVFLGSMIMFRGAIALKAASALVPLLLVISIYCYTRIFHKLRHQEAQVRDHIPQHQANGGGNSLNIARYKNSVSCVSWVQLALVACYAPWSIVCVLPVSGMENRVARLVAETLVYFNSSLNPILYCWKIRAVRQAVKDARRQLNCLNFFK